MEPPEPSLPSVTSIPGGPAALPPRQGGGHPFGDRDGDACRAFRGRFADLPLAGVDPLYALPAELIDAIDGWPRKWLTPDEVHFERELAAVVAGRRAVGIAEDTFVSDSVLAGADAGPAAAKALARELEPSAGGPSAAAAGARRLIPQFQKRQSYLGWLLTDPRFVRERDALRAARAPLGLRVSFLAAFFHPSDADLRQFMDRWQLSGMSSWELPIPQGANLSGAAWPAAVATKEGTVHVSIPVTQSLGSDDPIREDIEQLRRRTRPPHLKSWLDVLERRGGNKGPGHYAGMLRVHFYLNLALRGRYGGRMQGNLAKLDAALGGVLGLSVERIRQLRLDADRRLRRPVPAV